MLGEILIGGMASLLIAVFAGPKFIEFLGANEYAQRIREEGPRDHHATKAGTPTMGGLLILLSVAIPYLILSDRDAAGLAVLGTAVVMGMLGFADDWIKVKRRRSLGLSGRVKIAVQLATAVALWYVAVYVVGIEPTLLVRVFDVNVGIGALYIPLIMLVLMGATNGVNLTDGLDGLAAGASAAVFLAYTAMAVITNQDGLALLSACLVGGCIGFLWYNSFPAAVFMGDTGSLALGGAIAALAVMTKTEVLLIVIGGIFAIEAASVLIQVISFKLTRKRVFLMAPIHHHFELMAWSETKIIVRFWITAAICSAIGFTLFQQSIGR